MFSAEIARIQFFLQLLLHTQCKLGKSQKNYWWNECSSSVLTYQCISVYTNNPPDSFWSIPAALGDKPGKKKSPILNHSQPCFSILATTSWIKIILLSILWECSTTAGYCWILIIFFFHVVAHCWCGGVAVNVWTRYALWWKLSGMHNGQGRHTIAVNIIIITIITIIITIITIITTIITIIVTTSIPTTIILDNINCKGMQMRACAV